MLKCTRMDLSRQYRLFYFTLICVHAVPDASSPSDHVRLVSRPTAAWCLPPFNYFSSVFLFALTHSTPARQHTQDTQDTWRTCIIITRKVQNYCCSAIYRTSSIERYSISVSLRDSGWGISFFFGFSLFITGHKMLIFHFGMPWENSVFSDIIMYCNMYVLKIQASMECPWCVGENNSHHYHVWPFCCLLPNFMNETTNSMLYEMMNESSIRCDCHFWIIFDLFIVFRIQNGLFCCCSALMEYEKYGAYSPFMANTYHTISTLHRTIRWKQRMWTRMHIKYIQVALCALGFGRCFVVDSVLDICLLFLFIFLFITILTAYEQQ